MAYPEWESGISYPVGSIVTYNDLTYEATQYHDPANFDPPNVEMGTDPVNPIFETQRGWTIYAATALPYYFAKNNVLIKHQDNNDDYVYFGQYAPGPYINDAQSIQYFAGSPNNPTTPCPADKCITMVEGPAYQDGFAIVRELINPIKPAGYTYYISGPSNYPSPDTLYVWWGAASTYCFRRQVTLTCAVSDLDGNITIENKSFTPSDDNYNLVYSTGIEWCTPGNVSTTFSFVGYHGFVSYDIEGND